MNMATTNRTRWLTLIGTIITQFALGSVYTWSLFNGPLANKLSEPVSQVAFSFGLLSLALAFSSSVAGKLQDRFGVRRVSVAGVLHHHSSAGQRAPERGSRLRRQIVYRPFIKPGRRDVIRRPH
jgi:predicted MFS family arabinose efflux permease